MSWSNKPAISLYGLPDSDKRVKLLPWQAAGLQYTRSGYGAKIPTTRQIRIDGRWHRVYCSVWSNIGTCWILKGGEKILVHD